MVDEMELQVRESTDAASSWWSARYPGFRSSPVNGEAERECG